MNDKEKLISLLILTDPNPYTCESESGSCELTTCTECRARSTADLLIANGVTVQEWIPVTERLPENNQWTLCFMKDKSFGTFRVLQWNYIDWQWNDGNDLWKEKDVTHWMPLPALPKGE